MSNEERIKFVKDLDLAVSLRGPSERAAVVNDSDTSQSAAVDNGSCVSFVSNLQGQMKADVLNSTLLAQLAATQEHDRQKETAEWYTSYTRVLGKVGWVVQNFDFVQIKDANTYLTVDKLIFKLAAQYLSGNELQLFKTMIEALRDGVNDAAENLFDSSSKELNKANFQLGVVSNSSGNAMFKIGAYTYEASQDIDQVLFFTFGSQKISFSAGNQTMVLDEEVYATVREAVLEKLGSAAKAEIASIKIPPRT